MPPKCEDWQATDLALGSFTVKAQHVWMAEIETHRSVRLGRKSRKGKGRNPCGRSKLWSSIGREKIRGKGLRSSESWWGIDKIHSLYTWSQMRAWCYEQQRKTTGNSRPKQRKAFLTETRMYRWCRMESEKMATRLAVDSHRINVKIARRQSFMGSEDSEHD